MTTVKREHGPWVHRPTLRVLGTVCSLGAGTLLVMAFWPLSILVIGSLLLLLGCWTAVRRQRLSPGLRAMAGLAGLSALIAMTFHLFGWRTVCSGTSPDGQRAVVECHQPWVLFARSHYYLTVEPERLMRPQAGDSTLKRGGSPEKLGEWVREEWDTRHFLGYLGPYDRTERAPNRVEWSGNLLTVFSSEGVAGRFEVR